MPTRIGYRWFILVPVPLFLLPNLAILKRMGSSTHGIFILGMHRSGTSLVTRLLQQCGGFVGTTEEQLTPSEWNRDGFWERQDVLHLNERLLDLMRPDLADWPAQKGWMKIPPDPAPVLADHLLRDWRRDRDRVFSRVKDENRPWLIKDPRLCLTLPWWREAAPDAPVLLVFRNPLEIARSLNQRNGLDLLDTMALWEAYMCSALRAAEGKILLVSLHDLLADPVDQLARILQALADYGAPLPGADRAGDAVEQIRRDWLQGTDRSEPAEAFFSHEGAELLASLAAGTVPNAPPSFSPLCRQRLEHLNGVKTERQDLHRQVRRLGQEQTCFLDEYREDVETLRSLDQALDEAVKIQEGLLNSMRWRVGKALGDGLDRVLRRRSPSPAEAAQALKTETEARPAPPVSLLPGDRPVRVIALVHAYNEERFMPAFLAHMEEQGVEVFLLDHESTDRTVEIAESFRSRNVVDIQTVPRKGQVDIEQMFRMKEQLACELDADWFIHVDPDEFRLPPPGSDTLQTWLTRLDRAGWNAVNFQEFTFVPWESEPVHTPDTFLETMRWYYPFRPVSPHRLNAWKKQEVPVDLVQDCGHIVRFEGIRPYPEAFPMRHYPILSLDHAREKYGGREYSEAEMNRGWHGWRHQLDERQLRLPSSHELRFYISDHRLDASHPLKHHLYIRAEAESAL